MTPMRPSPKQLPQDWNDGHPHRSRAAGQPSTVRPVDLEHPVTKLCRVTLTFRCLESAYAFQNCCFPVQACLQARPFLPALVLAPRNRIRAGLCRSAEADCHSGDRPVPGRLSESRPGQVSGARIQSVHEGWGVVHRLLLRLRQHEDGAGARDDWDGSLYRRPRHRLERVVGCGAVLRRAGELGAG